MLLFLGVSALVIATPGQDTALTIRNTLLGAARQASRRARGRRRPGRLDGRHGARSRGAARGERAGVRRVAARGRPRYLVWLGLRTLWSAAARRGLDGAPRPRGTASGRRVPAGAAQQPRQPEDACVLHEPAAAVQLDERGAARSRPRLLRAHDDLAERLTPSSSPVRAACSIAGRIRRALDAVTGTVLVAFGFRLAAERP